MGNQPSSSEARARAQESTRQVAERVKQVVGEVQEEIRRGVKTLEEENHPAAQFLDTVCGGGGYKDDDMYSQSQASSRYHHHRRKYGYRGDRDDYSEDGSRTLSEDDTTAYDDQSRRSRADQTVESQSYISQSDYDSDHRHKPRGRRNKVSRSFDTEDDTRTEASSTVGPTNPTSSALQKQPLASSFAKRCYFTKSGIGRTTQHVHARR